MPRPAPIVACAILALWVVPARGQFSYRLEDGTPENAVGIIEPGTWDLLWLNRFVRHVVFRQITSIEVAFGLGAGHGLEVGSPVEVLLYDDPTEGDARDAVLVRHVEATVQDLGYRVFNTFPIEPVIVNGFFHVGVVLRDTPGFTFPAACDLDAPHATGFSTVGNTKGEMDVANLASLPAEDYGTFEAMTGIAGNWLVRANGVVVPEPAGVTLLLAILALFGNARVRRSTSSG